MAETASGGADTALAMVLLPQMVVPQPADLDAAARNAGLGALDFNVQADAPNTIVFRISAGFGFISFAQSPVDPAELQLPVDSAWWWPDAAATVATHQAHLIVGVFGQTDNPLMTRILLTKLLGLVAQLSGASAVFWSEGSVLRSTPDFLALSAEIGPAAIDTRLWINALIESDPEAGATPSPDGTVALMALTRGLEAFQQMDIQTRAAFVQPQQLFDTLHNFANYLITRGAVVADGDTVGHTQVERITVRHQPNLRDAQTLAYQLVWPQPAMA